MLGSKTRKPKQYFYMKTIFISIVLNIFQYTEQL